MLNVSCRDIQGNQPRSLVTVLFDGSKLFSYVLSRSPFHHFRFAKSFSKNNFNHLFRRRRRYVRETDQAPCQPYFDGSISLKVF